jgi:hypothetical protein
VGLAEQWDELGRRIVATRFVAGTGLDLWHCGCGLFTETWLVRGLPHGPERDWHGARRVRYWVRGERVDRRAYERARRDDPTLPSIDAKDDRPRRAPPPELRRAVARLREPR